MASRILLRLRRLLAAALMLPGLAAWLVGLACFTHYPWRLYHWLGTDEFDLGGEPRFIVVLGGGGIPSASGLTRTYRAAEEGRRFTNAVLIVALPVEGDFDSSAAARMQAELIMRGMEPARLRIEPKGRNTREQALNIRRMLGRETIEAPVLLVTSPEHLKRSLWTFRKAGFERIAGSASFSDSLETPLAYGKNELGGQARWPLTLDSRSWLRYGFWNQLGYLGVSARELTALAYYWARGWI